MDFLIGPFSSQVGQRIQKATKGSLESEDWGLNMEICDIINETDDGPKDAMKALKKRIVGNKNFREVMLALTVLETCVKNCGNRFHVYVCTRDFVEGVLVRTILPKNNPPMVLHDRVLSLIQAWADAFRNVPSLSGVVSVYDDLKKRGLQFPMTDLDSLSPIHTPNRIIAENNASAPSASESAPNVASTHTSPILQTNGAPEPVSPEQKQKLRAELGLVRGNLNVMTEMLNQLRPGESSSSDTELLQQLYSVCKDMQKRVVELIPSVSDEELIGELLVINDELNNAFIRYERFERLSIAQGPPTDQKQGTENLIDLNQALAPDNQMLVSPVNQPVTQLGSAPVMNTGDDDFDMFAQTRGRSLAEERKSVRYEDPGAVEGLAEALDNRHQITAGPEGMKEGSDDWSRQSQWIYTDTLTPAPQNAAMEDIEKWLSSEAYDYYDGDDDDEGVTSEEFDKFLAQRAKAVEHLPSVQRSSENPPQSAQTQESTQDPLFTL